MNLIQNWRSAWRMVSVQSMAASVLLQSAWTTNQEQIAAVLPAAWVPRITVGLLVIGIVGRLVKQSAVSGPEGTP